MGAQRWLKPPVTLILPRAFCAAGCGMGGLTAFGPKEGPTPLRPAAAFPGNGQMPADLAEIAALKTS